MNELYQIPPAPRFPVGKRELLFGGSLLVCCVFLWNCILYGGFHLGFALGYIAVTVCSCIFLMAQGYGFDRYSGSLILLSLIIAAGFGRSSDGFVKLVMLFFLMFATNLGFCLAAKQNYRSPGGIGSVLDAPRAFFVLGVGSMGASARGLSDARKASGTAGKQTMAALAGLLAAVPVVLLLLHLLVRADAAFEGLMDLLPEPNWREPCYSLVMGCLACWVLFSRNLGLHHGKKKEAGGSAFPGISAITVNIILCAVSLVYMVYLVSQLAYFSGGLSGILPEGFTLARYARRGFFEMAWLSAINLGLMCLAMGLAEKKKKLRLTKIGCLFLGIVTLFLITTASAKMLLYIGSYGLTRLRVLTQVIMVWLAITTILVCIWLVKPQFAYMKAVILAALIIGAAVLWVDVDTQVARYNVRAYQSGKLQTVDVPHLRNLGYGAIPYLEELARSSDPAVANSAAQGLRRYGEISDFRDWSWAEAQARKVLEAWQAEPES